MPRPARRAPSAQGREDGNVTTPTRPAATNAITANIPAFMLETPTGPRFQTTPVPRAPSQNDLSVPEASRPNRLRRQQRVELLDAGRAPDTTPINSGQAQDNADQSFVSSVPLGSVEEEDTWGEEDGSYLDSNHANSEDAKALIGLRDISSLATWTLSSAKPGCALAQLRHPSHLQFWQSDGPQPHTLTLHFFKLVSIVKMRVYLDFKLDESYTPTKMKFFAGMSEGGLVEFSSWEVEDTTDPETGETSSNVEKIRGWIDVNLKGVGGQDAQYYEDQEARKAKVYERRIQQEVSGIDMMDVEDEGDEDDDPIGGDVLRAMIVQVRVCENHQNGKDTHVRGFQIFAKDESTAKEMRKMVKRPKARDKKKGATEDADVEEFVGLRPAAWMGEPEIR